ncbi:MAG TPA: tryptophan--tRNA ligase [Candidatus Nanoarchaeia archaeon]|nr:tryptophan--tRNA ligase [Candidatus Nanoarchaeia archaeon]
MNCIDPWGKIEIKDYNTLCDKFGIDKFFKILPKISNPSLSMRRGLIFGHKDFQVILKAINEKKDFVMMTGLMPSGRFHLGHKMIAEEIIYYQKLGAECFIAVADLEAYLTRNISLEQAKEIAIDQYLLNYIALGLKPNKVHFYFQTNGTKSYMNLSKMISKKTTFNEITNIYGETSPVKIVSALTQVADILHPQLKEFGGPKPTVVPVGADQLPHINFTRDIAYRMSSEFKFISPSAVFNKVLPGLKGGKMSSSDITSYIALTDSPKDTAKKIKNYAFSGGQATVEEHRKKGGNPDVDISYQLLRFGLEENDKKLEKIYDDYKSGKLLSGELKEILIEKLTRFLEQHQEKREKAKNLVDKFLFN